MSGPLSHEVRVLELSWTHTCRPPRQNAHPPPHDHRSLTDQYAPGEVWYCGCGRAWGNAGQEWQRVERIDRG